MSIDVNSLKLRLENIEIKCSALIEKDWTFYEYVHYGHLWKNFEQIREMLSSQFPGAFDDIPKRELKLQKEDFNDELVVSWRAVDFLKGDVADCLRLLNQIDTTSQELRLPDQGGELTIPEYVRRDIFDLITLSELPWSGRLSEVDFLKRIYPIDELPSNDYRFSTAAGDINQHRVMNYDWQDDWVFSDDRFNLLNGPDSTFLDFLCQTVHPVIRSEKAEVDTLVSGYNEHLSKAGWHLVAQATGAGKSIYTAVKSYSSVLVSQLNDMHESLNTEYISKLLHRMHSSIDADPELAIGSAKEFLESVCKTVLNDQKIAYNKDDNLQQLVKKAVKELKLDPDDLPENTKALESIRPLLKSLGTISHMMAELRGQFGTGHGKDARTKGLGTRHAKLAVGASSAVAIFLYETYQERNSKEDADKMVLSEAQ